MARKHPSTDEWDIKLLRTWLHLAIQQGTNRIKIVVGSEPNTWVVRLVEEKK